MKTITYLTSISDSAHGLLNPLGTMLNPRVRIGVLVGLTLMAWHGAAEGIAVIVHFDDPPSVIDRTPLPGPGVNEFQYSGPGHPHATEFLFRLDELVVSVARNDVWIPEVPTTVDVLRLSRRRSWSCCELLLEAHEEGSEVFQIDLVTADTNLLTADLPRTWPLGRFESAGNSKVAYDYGDPIYKGGGPFGGPASWSWTVVGYDVAVRWFELVAVPDLPAPSLSVTSSALGGRVLTWNDPWKAFALERAETLASGWQPVSATLGYHNGTRSLDLGVQTTGFYRLVSRANGLPR